MRVFRTHWLRFTVIWLIACLLANAGLAQPLPQHISRAIESIAEKTVVSNTTTINGVLTQVGFDQARQAQVLDWRGMSPVRKVETAYWSAERARAGSGEDLLALLARQLSSDYPDLHVDSRVQPFLKRPVANLAFASLHAPPADLPAPRIQGAIIAMAHHVDQSDLIFTEALLHAGGVQGEDVYRILRESKGPSRYQALVKAVTSHRSTQAMEAATYAMAQYIVEHGGPNPPQEITEILRNPSSPPTKPDGVPQEPRSPDPEALPPEPDDLPRVPAPRAPDGGGGAGGLSLGGMTVESPPAAPLEPQGISAGAGAARAILEDIRFNLAIGGIAFGEIATPARGTRIGTLRLHYDPSQPDGQRTAVIIDDKRYSLETADWILLPAAAWANDKEVAVLTGFGKLQQPDADAGCRLVFNYAPAIDGTLIGLRLMQADIVLKPSYSDLFKSEGHYLVGTGEVAPTPDEIAARDRAHATLLPRLPYSRSYILTDAERRLTFAVAEKHIVFSGQPVYRLWKTAQADPVEDKRIDHLGQAAIVNRANAAEKILLARLASRPLELTWETLTAEDVQVSAEIARRFASSSVGRDALRDLEDWARATKVIRLGDNPLSDPKVIEPLNPTVYKAVTRFAQLAAFFRYVQANHPKAWAAFLRQVPPPTSAQPPVTLPTCVP